MDDKTVTVYVRKGSRNDSRTFSFDRLNEIEDIALLDKGIAIDGNQAMFEIVPDEDGNYAGPFVDTGDVTLSEMISEVESNLVEWFEEIGYSVEFG